MNKNYIRNKMLFGSSIMAIGLSVTAGGMCYAQNLEQNMYKEYVMMNIPYGEFYAGEYEGGERIDAVSTATMNKAGNEGLTGGSYHTEDLGKILGLSFPVAVSEDVVLDVNLERASIEELYGAPDYSYVRLTEIPEFYKVVTMDGTGFAFSKAEGDVKEQSYESVSITTSSPWADYVIEFDQNISELNPYAAVIKTEDGSGYGLRTLENIWRGFELAFTVTEGFREPHGNTVAYEAYEDIAGKRIKEIVYYTADGMKSFNVDLYVPVKFNNSISIEDANITDGNTSVILEGFPEDYEDIYTLTGDGTDMICTGTEISWSGALAGEYTLNISDASGKYAPYSQVFVLSTDNAAAKSGEECIVKNDNASDEEFDAYIRNIASVTVGDQEISASGKRSTKLILGDGSVDKTQAGVFSEIGDYELTIHSSGSEDITITVHIDEVAESDSNGESAGKH